MKMERGVRVCAWGYLPATLGMCGQTMGLHAGVAGNGGTGAAGAPVRQAVGRGHDGQCGCAQAPGSILTEQDCRLRLTSSWQWC